MNQSIINTLLVIASIIICSTLQYTGLLQSLELSAFDKLLLNRPITKVDHHIVIIGETEADIRRYGHPLSDQVLTDAIYILEQAGARVIGIDKYRDTSIPPGTKALRSTLQKNKNIIWIFFSGNTKQDAIASPKILSTMIQRVGFNDIIEDSDGVVRRGLLFLDIDNTSYYAFPLLLALHYLTTENINPKSDSAGYLSLNGISLPPIKSDFGAYQEVDSSGYQIMLNYPGLPQPFSSFTLSELLDGKINVSKIQDKIVILGSSAPSLLDFRLFPNKKRRLGVEYHAYLTSQLLNTAINRVAPLRSWSNMSEFVWVLLWCVIGIFTSSHKGNLFKLFIWISLELLLLLYCSSLIINQNYWIPVIAPIVGWSSSFLLSTLYLFRREHIERTQLMQLFSSHVSPDVATQLWSVRKQFFYNGYINTDTLTTTILFTDLSNFTNISENTDPLILMSWLNQYMNKMSGIAMEHGGMVNKFIGDSIMVVFGAPIKRIKEEDIAQDARQALLCAVNFNLHLFKLNEQWKSQGLPTTTMRVGIHTGAVIAGSLGSSARMEYTVIGDAVNIASRLESFDNNFAKPNNKYPCRILISETTFNYTNHLYEMQPLNECLLKGKKKKINIYHVIIKS